MRALLLAALALTACAEEEDVTSSQAAVVYETDGRTEPYAHPSAVHRALAESAIAIKMHEGWLDRRNPSDVQVTYTRTTGEAHDLCDGERFADQIEPGQCSATLIDDRHLLTAGHCVDEEDDCGGELVWVLGLRLNASGRLERLSNDDIYRCNRVVASHQEGLLDYAVVQLDRRVVGHRPAPVRRAPMGLPVGTPVTIIGHPGGIPMKIDSGGIIIDNSEPGSAVATLDAFSGNSGSGIFDAAGQLIGILRAGIDDYTPRGSCNMIRVIGSPPPGWGEDLTYATPAIDAFCATGARSPVCGCAAGCEPPPGDMCDDAERLDPDDQTLTGSLDGYQHGSSGECGGAGPERSWVFSLDEPMRLAARAAGFDSVLYLRDGCTGSERTCNDDDPGAGGGSFIDVELAAGDHHLFLDAQDVAVGAFTLMLDFEPVPREMPSGPPDAGAVESEEDPWWWDQDGGPSPDPGTLGSPTLPPGQARCACNLVGQPLGGPWHTVVGGVALLLVTVLRRRR